MIIRKLFISGYRNLEKQELDFSENINFIIGKNAQGKTNFLEAIHLFSRVKSFRTSKNSDLINWSSDLAFLKGDFKNNLTNYQVELIVAKDKREIFLNSKAVNNIAEYLGNVRTVSFVPDNLSLVKGQPALRREFLDRHMVDLDNNFLATLVKYNKARASKAVLLKKDACQLREIEPWNELLAKLSAEIIQRREEFLKSLLEKSKTIYQEFVSGDGEFTLNINSNLYKDSIISADEILSKLNEEFPKEKVLRQAYYGIHRDDLLINLKNKKARTFASQGQIRTITLVLKLAVVELIEEKFQDSPILLLDDLDSELDRDRLSRLYDLLFSQSRQTFITGTEIRKNLGENIAKNRHKIFTLNDGKITSFSQ